MALSYKALAEKARIRLKTLEKIAPKSESLENLKNNLEVFYSRNEIKQTTKSGISFTKKMSVDERKEMSRILRVFLKDDLTTATGINKEFNKVFNEYKKDDSIKSTKYDIDDLNNLSYQDKLNLLERLKRVVEDRKFKESLGSDVLYTLYYKHMLNAENPLNYETLRKAMARYIKNNGDDENKTSAAVVDDILKYYDDIINESGE